MDKVLVVFNKSAQVVEQTLCIVVQFGRRLFLLKGRYCSSHSLSCRGDPFFRLRLDILKLVFFIIFATFFPFIIFRYVLILLWFNDYHWSLDLIRILNLFYNGRRKHKVIPAQIQILNGSVVCQSLQELFKTLAWPQTIPTDIKVN